MSNFTVGKKYKLVDASKCVFTQEVVDSKQLQFPQDNTFTCHRVDADGDAWTKDTGVLWNGKHACDVMCAGLISLKAGAFEEVTNG